MDVPVIRPGPRGFLEREGEEIYFECWGEGQTLVLCHGLGGNHVVWYQQVPVLAQNYQVVTWDQRGFGRSSSNTGRFGPDAAVGDLAAILDLVESERAHLIGQSMGGWAALGFAIAHQDRAESLVLADTVGGIFTEDIREALTGFRQNLESGPSPQELDLGFHPAVGAQLASEDLARSFLYAQIGGMASPPVTEVVDVLNSTDYTDGAGDLDVPTLLIVGSNDPIFPPPLIRQAADVLRHGQVVEIPATGHSPYFETPDVWNREVIEFLAELAKPAP